MRNFREIFSLSNLTRDLLQGRNWFPKFDGIAPSEDWPEAEEALAAAGFE
jgi:hypothetical protein